MNFTEENNAERMAFVDRWAAFVRTHSDREWSRQQNIIINSTRTVELTKAQYLAIKEKTRTLSTGILKKRIG